MPVFRMAFNGYAVQFSPFDDRIAVATAQNFGIIGNGKQYVLKVAQEPISLLSANRAPRTQRPPSAFDIHMALKMGVQAGIVLQNSLSKSCR